MTSINIPIVCTPYRFIISYFLLNQTIAIFEPKKDNTGMGGGKFLERIKVKKEGEVSAH